MKMPKILAHLLFYPTLWWNLFLCRVVRCWDWANHVETQLMIGAFPIPWFLRQYKQHGIKAVVNTCEEYEGPLSFYREEQIEQFYMPTVDFTPPSLTDVQQAVDFIEQQIAGGKTVYVHCKAGRGRSATVVLCYLIKKKQFTPLQAQQYLQAKRVQVLKRAYQRTVVQAFYLQLCENDPHFKNGESEDSD